MRITPLDVRKQEFRKVVRGLDADEVYAFLTTVADEYEAVLSDNKQLREKVIDLDEKVSEYRNMETTLRDTLLTAERVMSEARQNARKEAELILRDASIKASEQTASIASEVDKLKGQLRELRGQRDAFLARLQSLAESQIGLAESYRRDFEREDRDLDPPSPRTARVADEGPTVAGDDEDPTVAVDDETRTSREPAGREAVRVEQESPSPALEDEPDAPVDERSLAPADDAPESAPKLEFSTKDEWRGYEVGASASSRETDAAGAPPEAPAAPAAGATPEAGAPPEAPTAPAAGATPEAGARPESREEETEVSAPVSDPAPPVETRVDALPDQAEDPSHEDPIDRVARMMAEAAGDDGVELVEDLRATSGQRAEAVASSPAADEPSGHEEPEEGESRWSLSRFTKGLSNF